MLRVTNAGVATSWQLGAPMFGHGQFEGYAEKYGMEYSKAYWDEEPDAGLLDYHAQVITPLLYNRDLFSGVHDFALYDVVGEHGQVAESVFAYSNRSRVHGRRSLVLYNNAFDQVTGRIKMASPVNVGSEEHELREKTLGEALGIRSEGHVWYALQELRTGQWYLRRGSALHHEGLGLQLDGYQAQVFMEIREIEDHDGRWAEFAGSFGGGAIADLDRTFEVFWEERDALRFAAERGPRPYPTRGAGLLMHPTSLPGPEGIGTIGQPALDAIEWMADAGLKVWQVLPLCPGGAGLRRTAAQRRWWATHDDRPCTPR